ncbi:maleylpyruvate isomerase family mycothiol-dependent enzyme [Leekyejoonella antrihumi]|uniref:Maleylpyruvate isomerase family mycothiol-dependent enzyme n=1 Tax=Leekyejoonella antrihumi TaxID=1660198 RepID=A0A563E3G0_9MICO|nr:maleylpyruvate isomerase family mycothiol-dependent enzyme [Leekyejoonella antrihumi]
MCPRWSVRDVVGHIASYDVLSWPAGVALFARSGFSPDRCNRVGVEPSRQLRTEELVARLRAHAVPRGVTTMFGCAIALTDGLIHHQDIRRALGNPRAVPQERLVAALEFVPRARTARAREPPRAPGDRDRHPQDARNRSRGARAGRSSARFPRRPTARPG